MTNDTKNQHISHNERKSWTEHIGSSGVQHHKLGNGNVAGFSTNDFTNARKATLERLDKQVQNVRITINASPPSSPIINNEIWIHPSEKTIRIYTSNGWEKTGAIFL